MGQDQSRKYERFENPRENRGNRGNVNRAFGSWKDEQPNRSQQAQTSSWKSSTQKDDKSKNLMRFD